MSEVSPLDILGHTFSTRFRGYAAGEVHELLSQVAGTLEKLMRERGELRQQVRRLEQELTDFRQREAALQDALVAAQRSAQSTRETARTEAQRIVEEAHTLSERLLEEANDRAQKIELVVAELRGRRREARSELLRMVELLRGLAEDDQAAEQEERATGQLALMQRKEKGSSA